MAGFAPWELVESPGRYLRLGIYEGGGWLLLLVMLAFAGWTGRTAWKRGPASRFAKLLPAIVLALIGVGVCVATVRRVSVYVDFESGASLTYRESRLPDRTSHAGRLLVQDIASVIVIEVPGRRGPTYKLAIRTKGGVEHVPDRVGTSERSPQDAVAERLRAFLAKRP